MEPTTSTEPGFKPTQVVLGIPPLVGTLRKAELEFGAALIVLACQHHGDVWAPTSLARVQAASKVSKWAMDMLAMPFIRPWFMELVPPGWAKFRGEPGPTALIELTPAFFAAIREKWVRPA